MNGHDAGDFAEMALRFHQGENVEETVELIADHALHAVGCTHAGVAHISRGRITMIAQTDDLVRGALRRAPGAAFDIADAEADDRPWVVALAAHGIRSALALPLSTGERVVGLLVLLHEKPEAFDADDRAVAAILARHAAVALASARVVENLWIAIDARKLVGQAQGILMERHQLSADQAFAVLMRYSQQRNIKLRDVAAELVERRRLPDA